MLELTGLRLERARASSQFSNGRFRNAGGVALKMNGPTMSTMGEFFFGGKARVPKGRLPVFDPRSDWTTRPATDLRITWLGHSTLLLESSGLRILTDPVFGDRASPVSFAGPKRFHPAPVRPTELPKLDAILLSHDHYDHLCEATMRELAKLGVPVVTSLGVGARLETYGFDPKLVNELDWWETFTFPGGTLAFTATPAQHFSGRGIGDRNVTLWSSWVIRTDRHRLFFSGDTGYTDQFRTIAEKLGPFDVTMLEIGAWNPAWGTIHLGPENALRAFDALGGGTLLPVHWGTFDLALHKWDEPAETLLALARTEDVRVLTPALGRPFEPSLVEGPTPWWRTVDAEAAASELTAPRLAR